jgi:hypothetical protein
MLTHMIGNEKKSCAYATGCEERVGNVKVILEPIIERYPHCRSVQGAGKDLVQECRRSEDAEPSLKKVELSFEVVAPHTQTGWRELIGCAAHDAVITEHDGERTPLPGQVLDAEA